MQINDDREVMPIFDESIFYPERRAAALGLDEDDIRAIVEMVRWHMNQRDKRLAKQGFVQLLRQRQTQIAIERKSELLRELELLSQLFAICI